MIDAPGGYLDGPLPANVGLGAGTVLSGEKAFSRFFARHPEALVIGRHCAMNGAVFAVGKDGRLAIGDHCQFTCPILLCEDSVRIGNYVLIGWNATITDADFHPVPPVERMADAIAISNLPAEGQRHPFATAPVVIDDGAWIGPQALILKGVHIGAGAFIEPGAVVTRNVPPHCRVQGNPARVIGEV